MKKKIKADGYNISTKITEDQGERLSKRIRGIAEERGENEMSIRGYMAMLIEADLRLHESPADERPTGKKERVK